jgi:hypothetical protein
MLFVFTVAPGSSILDLNIDVGTKVLALYVAYMAWALLTALAGEGLLHPLGYSPHSQGLGPQTRSGS